MILLLSVPRPGQTAAPCGLSRLQCGLPDGDEWIFDVVADAFLYRMVRRMVFVQVAVGLGKIQAEAFRQALESQESASRRAGFTGRVDTRRSEVSEIDDQ